MEETREGTRAAKSMQTAHEAGYFGKKMMKNVYKASQEGRPIGWSMVTFYEGELIPQAMGMELVFPENFGAFCAAFQMAEPYLERCESDGFPSTLCGYARNCFGYASMMKDNDMQPPPGAPGGGMPKPTLLLGSGAVCDARYKWFQALGRYLDDTPVWTLEHPHPGTTEYFLPENKKKTIAFIVAHLKEFVSFLEDLLGKKMDWDRLEEMVDQSYKTLKLAHEVDLLRQTTPSPMAAQDFWSIMIPHLYLSHDPEAYEFYKRVYDEVKDRVDNKIGAVPHEAYRLMFCELPPWHSLGFFDKLAEKFGIAMVYESWGYHAPIPVPEDELSGVNDPLELIAHLTFRKFTDGHDTSLQHGVDAGSNIGAYLKAGKEYRADGLLCHPLMSCRAATYTLLATKNVLEEVIKVPSVVVDGDIVDLRVFNEKEALSKVESFVETMDHYREERKKAGMSW
ncbi:2-hydroxyacyl-CoA dehydratase [Thermodesulfobacteriota bacterium]